MSVKKNGKLVVIGSGIKSIAHFTLESQAHLQQADIVLYAASDPVTDMWIEQQNPNAFDLYQYYGNDKNRIITYTQMIERIMEEVRAGKYVCALFYGHPGVFVTPSHNSIEIARREGYEAEMLPGISAEDCLFADLGVDPSIPGLQTYEATDLLLRKRPINTEINAVVWQVGCVGDVGFKFHGYGNEKLNILLDYLEEFYSPEQEVINYVASMFSMAKPKIDRHRLADFRDPEVAKSVTGISTFFIPAARMADSDAAASTRLGLSAGKSRATPLICDHELYPSYKKAALQNIANHTIPDGYKFSHGSKALYDLVSTLALDFDELNKFKASPKEYLKSLPGLTPNERNMLAMQHHGALRMLFKRDRDMDARIFVTEALKNPLLAERYATVQRAEHEKMKSKEISAGDYEARLVKWFLDEGFATTPSAVTRATEGIVFEEGLDYSGDYQCQLNGNGAEHNPRISIDVRANLVKVNDKVVRDPTFSNDHVIWKHSQHNNSTAILTFSRENSCVNLLGKFSPNSAVLPEKFNLTGVAGSSVH
jgi:precorrin-6B methylase 1